MKKNFPLGFGFMRLPTIDGKIDNKASNEMLARAIDSGVNYLDSALPYHNGESETFLGNHLTPAMRDKVAVATKLPTWLVQSPADMDKFLDQQLKNLKTDCIDFYLLHALNITRWTNMEKFGALEFLDRAKKSGKIRHTGFSYHDGLPLFKKIIDSYKWDVAQIQLNILDIAYQAGVAGMKYAAERGVGVVVMEPLKGGMLGAQIEGDFSKIAAKYNYVKSTFADLCLKWLWAQPEVGVVLSGMSNMQQLEENIISANDVLKENIFTDEQNRLVSEVREIYKTRLKVGCTGCAYCRPCPSGVDILECFRLYNEGSITGNWKGRHSVYHYLFAPERGEKRASECVECGICEERCPQNIPIRDRLKEIVEVFERTTY